MNLRENPNLAESTKNILGTIDSVLQYRSVEKHESAEEILSEVKKQLETQGKAEELNELDANSFNFLQEIIKNGFEPEMVQISRFLDENKEDLLGLYNQFQKEESRDELWNTIEEKYGESIVNKLKNHEEEITQKLIQLKTLADIFNAPETQLQLPEISNSEALDDFETFKNALKAINEAENKTEKELKTVFEQTKTKERLKRQENYKNLVTDAIGDAEIEQAMVDSFKNAESFAQMDAWVHGKGGALEKINEYAQIIPSLNAQIGKMERFAFGLPQATKKLQQLQEKYQNFKKIYSEGLFYSPKSFLNDLKTLQTESHAEKYAQQTQKYKEKIGNLTDPDLKTAFLNFFTAEKSVSQRNKLLADVNSRINNYNKGTEKAKEQEKYLENRLKNYPDLQKELQTAKETYNTQKKVINGDFMNPWVYTKQLNAIEDKRKALREQKTVNQSSLYKEKIKKLKNPKLQKAFLKFFEAEAGNIGRKKMLLESVDKKINEYNNAFDRIQKQKPQIEKKLKHYPDLQDQYKEETKKFTEKSSKIDANFYSPHKYALFLENLKKTMLNRRENKENQQKSTYLKAISSIKDQGLQRAYKNFFLQETNLAKRAKLTQNIEQKVQQTNQNLEKIKEIKTKIAQSENPEAQKQLRMLEGQFNAQKTDASSKNYIGSFAFLQQLKKLNTNTTEKAKTKENKEKNTEKTDAKIEQVKETEEIKETKEKIKNTETLKAQEKEYKTAIANMKDKTIKKAFLKAFTGVTSTKVRANMLNRENPKNVYKKVAEYDALYEKIKEKEALLTTKENTEEKTAFLNEKKAFTEGKKEIKEGFYSPWAYFQKLNKLTKTEQKPTPEDTKKEIEKEKNEEKKEQEMEEAKMEAKMEAKKQKENTNDKINETEANELSFASTAKINVEKFSNTFSPEAQITGQKRFNQLFSGSEFGLQKVLNKSNGLFGNFVLTVVAQLKEIDFKNVLSALRDAPTSKMNTNEWFKTFLGQVNIQEVKQDFSSEFFTFDTLLKRQTGQNMTDIMTEVKEADVLDGEFITDEPKLDENDETEETTEEEMPEAENSEQIDAETEINNRANHAEEQKELNKKEKTEEEQEITEELDIKKEEPHETNEALPEKPPEEKEEIQETIEKDKITFNAPLLEDIPAERDETPNNTTIQEDIHDDIVEIEEAENKNKDATTEIIEPEDTTEEIIQTDEEINDEVTAETKNTPQTTEEDESLTENQDTITEIAEAEDTTEEINDEAESNDEIPLNETTQEAEETMPELEQEKQENEENEAILETEEEENENTKETADKEDINDEIDETIDENTENEDETTENSEKITEIDEEDHEEESNPEDEEEMPEEVSDENDSNTENSNEAEIESEQEKITEIPPPEPITVEISTQEIAKNEEIQEFVQMLRQISYEEAQSEDSPESENTFSGEIREDLRQTPQIAHILNLISELLKNPDALSAEDLQKLWQEVMKNPQLRKILLQFLQNKNNNAEKTTSGVFTQMFFQSSFITLQSFHKKLQNYVYFAINPSIQTTLQTQIPKTEITNLQAITMFEQITEFIHATPKTTHIKLKTNQNALQVAIEFNKKTANVVYPLATN